MNGNPFYVQPMGDYSKQLSGLGQMIGDIGREKKTQARFQEVQGAMQSAWESQDPNKMAEVAIMYPEARESVELMFGFYEDEQGRNPTKPVVVDTYRRALADPQNAEEYLTQGINQVSELGGEPMNMITDLGMFRRDPESAVKNIEMGFAAIDPDGYKAYQKQQGAGGSDIASIRDRDSLFGIIEDESAPEWKKRAARIELGLDPRAMGSSAITTATTPGLTETVGESEADIAGRKSAATTSARLQEEGKYKPSIAAAVQEAKDAAKSRGEKLSEYQQAQAAMPALTATVDQLKALAPIATYSMGGKAFDTIAKQLGFGSTEGANARAKYIAIVSNQTLPLLKQTFGAAFTVSEANELKATLGDPDATPEEKLAQLEAFIEQKIQELATKEAVSDAVSEPEAESPSYSEGTIIQNSAGDRMILKNNQWVPYGG